MEQILGLVHHRGTPLTPAGAAILALACLVAAGCMLRSWLQFRRFHPGWKRRPLTLLAMSLMFATWAACLILGAVLPWMPPAAGFVAIMVATGLMFAAVPFDAWAARGFSRRRRQQGR